MQIDNLTGQTKSFAIACYDDNSIDELEIAFNGDPDETDLNEWRITPEQWLLAIATALIDKRNDDK